MIQLQSGPVFLSECHDDDERITLIMTQNKGMLRESDKHVDMTSDMVLLLICPTSKVKIVSGPKKLKIHGNHNLHNDYKEEGSHLQQELPRRRVEEDGEGRLQREFRLRGR